MSFQQINEKKYTYLPTHLENYESVDSKQFFISRVAANNFF